MTDQRARLTSYVTDHPGVHFSGLQEALDLATGQTQYHLHRLVRDGDLDRMEFYGRTHYYPIDCPSWDRAAFALARRETVRDVLLVLLESGPSVPATVADEIDIARSTLEHHLDHLTTHDIVRKERDSRNRVTLVLVQPEETVRVLETVAPSVSDRFIDRFLRLVDSVFEV
ncbi:winged helix-turn-helix transcriptional regulator [Halarchaeum salinum]|uniref:HVO-0163 N-terminal HTH domain-containing protein n=1 Tax=Halarchaeum salinum TaxID=489912 RepID=A0AAV3S3T0_9EURY